MTRICFTMFGTDGKITFIHFGLMQLSVVGFLVGFILTIYFQRKEMRMKKNKHSLKISRSFFGDTTLDGYPIVTYSNDELKILKNLLMKVLCEVNEYIKD